MPAELAPGCNRDSAVRLGTELQIPWIRRVTGPGLQAVGSVSPHNGFPLCYRDTDSPMFPDNKGLELELCLDASGFCRVPTRPDGERVGIVSSDPTLPFRDDYNDAGRRPTCEVGSRAIGFNPLGMARGGQESITPATHCDLVPTQTGSIGGITRSATRPPSALPVGCGGSFGCGSGGKPQ